MADPQATLSPDQLGTDYSQFVASLNQSVPSAPTRPSPAPAAIATAPQSGQPQQVAAAPALVTDANRDQTGQQQTVGPPTVLVPPPKPAVPTRGPYQIGQTITHNGQTYHVTGIDPANPDNPSIAPGPGDQQPRQPGQAHHMAPSPDAIAWLRMNPDANSGEFDARFGQGAAAREMGQEARPTHDYTPDQLGVRAQYVNFLQRKGVPPQVAQGIAHAVGLESSFDPGAVGDDGTSYGLFQAHAERAIGPGGLLKMADWKNPNVQFGWMWQQVHGGDKTATDHWNEIMQAPDEVTAFNLFRRYFERPAAYDSTLGSTDYGKQMITAIDKERADARAEMDTLLKQVQNMDTSNPEHEALKDRILQKEQELLEINERAALNPPTKKPVDMLQSFGSLATLIGIFAGMRSGAPLTASLNAAAGAINGINDRNEKDYQDQFNTWKQQTTLLSSLVKDEAAMYDNILNDDKATVAQKLERIKAAASIYGNIMADDAANIADIKSIATQTITLKKAQAELDKQVAGLDAVNDKNQRVQQATQEGDGQFQEWLHDPAHPERLKLSPVDQQVQRSDFINQRLRAAGLMPGGRAGAGGGFEVGHPFEIVDDKGGVIRKVMLREQKDQPGYIEAETGKPLVLNKGEHVMEVTPSTSGGGRAGAQVMRQATGGKEVLSDLQNVIQLPVGTTGGLLAGVQPGHSIQGALIGDLSRVLTGQDAQFMQASMAGVTRELSILMSPVYGGTGAALLMDPLVPKEGDTVATVIYKLARIAQSADNALETVARTGWVDQETKKFAVEMRNDIKTAIPWTTRQALDFGYRGKPRETFGDFVKQQGIAKPAWATGRSGTAARGDSQVPVYEIPGKGWFYEDQTPYQQGKAP